MNKGKYRKLSYKIAKGFSLRRIIYLDEVISGGTPHADVLLVFGGRFDFVVEYTGNVHGTQELNQLRSTFDFFSGVPEINPNRLVPVLHKEGRIGAIQSDYIKTQKVHGKNIILMNCQQSLEDFVLH